MFVRTHRVAGVGWSFHCYQSGTDWQGLRAQWPSILAVQRGLLNLARGSSGILVQDMTRASASANGQALAWSGYLEGLDVQHHVLCNIRYNLRY